ncbi:MAG: type IV pilus secretin family protein [Betaproteobacteria bacterium]|nr:MAG: type IV pilus secretin family protein [Betaproteobacteria bacterium]
MNVYQSLRLSRRALGCATAMLLSLVVSTPLTWAQNVIEDVAVARGGAGRTTMTFALKDPLSAPPTVFAIATPPRLVLDFANTSNAGKAVAELSDAVVRSYNVIQAQGRTRVVLNLTKSQAYDLKVDGNKLSVSLFDAPGTSAAESSPETGRFAASSKSDGANFTLRDVDFRRGTGGEGRVIIDLSDANSGIEIKPQGKVLIVDFLRTQVPRNLERKLDVTDFGTPVQLIDTFVQGNNTRMVIEPKGLWEHSAYQTDSRLIIEVKQIIEDPNKLTQGSRPGYKGDKLSLNFQDIAVRSVLQVIGDFTGLNIIVSDTVTGNVTLRLKDVPWDQALDLVMQARSLDMRKNGNVVWIAPKEELALKEKQELEAKAQVADIEPLRTELFQLNYQKAEEVRKMLVPTNAGGGGGAGAAQGGVLSKRGTATVDTRTNVLVVQDTPSKLEEVRRLIQRIDISIKQVLIEARVVVADDNFSRQLGARFGIGAGINNNGRNVGISGTPIGDPNQANVPTTGITTGFSPSSYYWRTKPDKETGGIIGEYINSIPYNVNLPVANPAGTLAMTFLNLGNGNLVNLELSAAEAANRGKVISSPRVVTADNQKASISQGQEYKLRVSGGVGGSSSVITIRAVLGLDVTPQVTPDGKVVLDVEVSKDSIAGFQDGSPIVNTKRVSTKVIVNNGDTAVLGGVYEEQITDTTDKVPFLGDAPFLGHLFKKTNKGTIKQELLIFLTPRVLSDTTGTVR